MTKTEQKQIDRATRVGRGELLRTLACIHRSGSSRTQREVLEQIERANCFDEFTLVNGTLVHNSEL